MSQNHYKCGRTNALGVHCTDSYVIKNVITLINTINAVIINKYISISKLTKGSLHLSLGSVIGFWQVFVCQTCFCFSPSGDEAETKSPGGDKRPDTAAPFT